MSDIKKLLENEVLSEEVKGALNEAIQEQIESVKQEAVEEAKNELEATYASKLADEKKALNQRVYEALDEMVKEEISELKDDIEYYKNIEVDYAKRLENFKEEYAKKLSEQFEKAVSEQVQKEFVELKEDISEAKKEHFGRKIYEAYKDEFERYGFGESDHQIRKSLEEVKKELNEAKKKIETHEREEIIESLVKDLSGRSREVMNTILENTPTEKLEDRYNKTVDKVLNENEEDVKAASEAAAKTSEEGRVVNENAVSEEDDDPNWSRVLRLARVNHKR